VLDYRCTLRNVDECLGALLVVCRDADVMIVEHNDLMLSARLRIHCNAFGALTYLDIGAVIAHPFLLAGIAPGLRIPAALPGDEGIASRPAQLVIHRRIRLPSVYRVHGA